jgi:hypothetical protein
MRVGEAKAVASSELAPRELSPSPSKAEKLDLKGLAILARQAQGDVDAFVSMVLEASRDERNEQGKTVR